VKDGDYFEGQWSQFVCVFCFVCFLIPFTEVFRHTTYYWEVLVTSWSPDVSQRWTTECHFAVCTKLPSSLWHQIWIS
jgi:hypothetical protein